MHSDFTPPKGHGVGFVGDYLDPKSEPLDRVGHLYIEPKAKRPRAIVTRCGRKVGRNHVGGFRVCAGWQSWARVVPCALCMRIATKPYVFSLPGRVLGHATMKGYRIQIARTDQESCKSIHKGWRCSRSPKHGDGLGHVACFFSKRGRPSSIVAVWQ